MCPHGVNDLKKTLYEDDDKSWCKWKEFYHLNTLTNFKFDNIGVGFKHYVFTDKNYLVYYLRTGLCNFMVQLFFPNRMG